MTTHIEYSTSEIFVVCRSNQLAKRTIDHPNFKNVSMSEAVNFLQDMPVGEALFRPSTKSLDIICLTIKVRWSASL